LENVGELDNALGDVFDFALALGNEGFVGVVSQTLLLGLEERGLREGAVGIGFLEGRVIVGVLYGCGSPEW
jgi:hypothetical protein